MIHPYLFVNLNNLVEVWLDGNDCVNSSFGAPYKSLTSMNGFLKNCYNNCLNDEECAANMTETASTTTTTMATTTTTELVQPEKDCFFQSKFEIFENQTISQFDELKSFCRIEINRTSKDLDLLKSKVDVHLTEDDVAVSFLHKKLSGFNQTVMEMKNKFDVALDAAKCQQENIQFRKRNEALEEKITVLNQKNEALSLFAYENESNKFKISEFIKKIENQEKQILSLENQLKLQRDEMQKKHEEEIKEKLDSLQMDLEAKLNAMNNKFLSNLQKEVQEYYDSIPK
jgi:DNA repair exonuclease SbcCD ATPase subunit